MMESDMKLPEGTQLTVHSATVDGHHTVSWTDPSYPGERFEGVVQFVPVAEYAAQRQAERS